MKISYTVDILLPFCGSFVSMYPSSPSSSFSRSFSMEGLFTLSQVLTSYWSSIFGMISKFGFLSRAGVTFPLFTNPLHIFFQYMCIMKKDSCRGLYTWLFHVIILPCFCNFCCSAIPTSCYILNVFYYLFDCVM